MNDLEQQLAQVRQAAEQARRDQASAEAKRAQAQGNLAVVEQAMRDEYPELAQMPAAELLAALAGQAEAEVSTVRAALSVAEGAA
jgi:hypothetical protein